MLDILLKYGIVVGLIKRRGRAGARNAKGNKIL